MAPTAVVVEIRVPPLAHERERVLGAHTPRCPPPTTPSVRPHPKVVEADHPRQLRVRWDHLGKARESSKYGVGVHKGVNTGGGVHLRTMGKVRESGTCMYMPVLRCRSANLRSLRLDSLPRSSCTKVPSTIACFDRGCATHPSQLAVDEVELPPSVPSVPITSPLPAHVSVSRRAPELTAAVAPKRSSRGGASGWGLGLGLGVGCAGGGWSGVGAGERERTGGRLWGGNVVCV